MAVNKRLLQGAAAAPGAITPSEHFGVVLYEGDGKSGRSVNGGKFGAGATFGIEKSTTQATDSRITTTYYAKNVGSISGWLKKNGNTSELEYVFVTKNDTGSAHQLGINLLQEGDSDLSARVGNGSSTTNVNTTGLTLNNDAWHHYVVTWNLPNGSNNVKVYVDGSLEATGSQSTGSWTGNSSRTFQLGHYTNTNTNNGFAGMQDQVRVFEKELSSSEVSTLYAETAETVTSLDPLSEDTTDTLQVLGDSSCIATYRFENNEDDESGNYDGTGTAIQYTAGRYGQAASFNGSNIGSGGAFVELQNSASIGNDVSAITMSVWVKFDNLNTQNFIIYRQDASDVANQGIYDYGNGTLYFQPINTNYGSDRGTISNSGLYTTGEWVHIVMVYDGSGTGNSGRLKAYINGSQVTLTYNGTQPTTTGSSSSRPLRIGGRRDGNATFSGDIDQVRIFNKALSASEVTTLYNENSLVASYRFEGNSNDDRRNFNGSDNDITYEYGLGFTPDLVWAKHRNHGTAHSHNWADSTRGGTKIIYSNTTDAQETISGSIQSFDTGGFTVGNSAAVNADGIDYVAWCFKANGGTTSSNTDGSITSTVQANTNAGFSIVKYTGTSAAATVGHGLSSAPEMIIVKKLGAAQDWWVYHKDLNGGTNPAHYFIRLNLTDAETLNASSGGSIWNSTAPTSTVFSTGTTLQESSDYIAYCFHSVDGFSKFGSYTGNGSDDGPIVETGFEPAFLMIKRTDTADSWVIHDNKRDLVNPRKKYLLANAGNSEAADLNGIDFLSNGFQLKDDYAYYNASSGTYIYMAFAADPDTEAPTVAKSFSTVTYTGNGGTQTISSLGYKPGLIWMKRRDTAQEHALVNIVSGPLKHLYSDLTSAEQTTTNGVSSFNDDGWTMGANGLMNNTNNTYVAWAWKADDNEPTIYGGAAKAVYKFEDNGNDVTGNNNATATSITYGTGKFNKGAIFNGTTSNFKTGSSFTGTNGGSFTLSCWVKIDNITGVENLLLGRFSYTTSDKQFILRVNNGGTVTLNVYNSSGTGESITTTDTLSIDTWYHIVAVVDGTKKSLYIDGELSVSETGSVSSNSTATGFLEIGGAGHLPASDAGRLDGMMDQVRIYNGAVSDVGAAALYAETTSDNDDTTLGGPPETIISANANAGFSIVKYEGTGVTGTRVPHGLSSAPELWIGKQLTGSAINWQVLYSGFSEGDYLTLNTNAAKGNSANVTFDPTATTVKFHANQALNDSGEEYIGYAFHSVSGYSKIGTYTGTGSSQTITTGFQPDWIVTKRTDTTDNWRMYDSVRQNTQPFDEILYPNLSNAEEDNTTFVTGTTSTGFTLGSGNGSNASGGTYIYMAFKIN